MKIGLIRHAKVIYSEAFFSSGKLFDEARKLYDISPVKVIELKIKTEDFPVCYVSTHVRAVETAKMIYDKIFITTSDLIEVPNAALYLKKANLPSILRSIIGRIAWYFNLKKMPETKNQGMERADKFIDRILSETNQNILLVTHGFFMHCLKKKLHKDGFKGHLPFFPKNNFLYLFERVEV